MSQWYAIYDTASKDVVGAGFFAEPEQVDPGTGNSLSAGQDGSIPNPLMTDAGEALYVYNTETHLVEPKA